MTAVELGVGALAGLGAAGLVCGVVSVAVFAWLADGEAMRRAARRMAADLLEMRLYLDEPGVVLGAQRDLLGANGRMLQAVAKPLAVLAPAMFLIGAVLDGIYGRAPLKVGEAAVVTVAWRGEGGGQGSAVLRARGCVAVETPGVRVPSRAQVSWRIRAAGACKGTLEVVDGGNVVQQSVAVEGGWARERRYGGLVGYLLDPLGGPVGDGRIRWIETGYREAAIAGWAWPWWFGLFTLAAGGAFAVLSRRAMAKAARAAAVLVAAAGLGRAAEAPVIVISIDTLRADHLGVYGYKKARTPNLDAMAEGGTVFDDASCQIPLTLPSHASMFTSTYPFENGVEENAERLPPGRETLAAVLKARGYATAAFVGSAMLGREYGLDAGFDVYDSPFRMPAGGGAGLAEMKVRRDGALVVRSAEAWMEAMRGRKVFVFVHLFDLHTPYPSGRVEPETAEYDARLEYVDRVVGRFRQALEKGGWWGRSVVVVMSDHGEGLGEHGEASHGYFNYRSTVRVALMVHWPAGAAKLGARVKTPVGLIDVAPGILDLLGAPAPRAFRGRSLIAAARVGGPVLSESVYARDQFGWAALRSIQDGRWRYIQAPKPELYDVASDAGEKKNAAAERRPEAEKMRSELAKAMETGARSAAARADSGAGTKEMLESLGYVAGGGAGRGSGADPKDRLGEFQRFEKGLEAMYAGRLKEAEGALGAVLSADGGNVPARGDLGDCYRREGRWAEAAREWEEALRRDPKYAPAAEALGEMWLGRKEYEKARRAFERLVEIDARSYAGQFGLGLADERLGRTEEARKHVEAACGIEPGRAACAAELRELGAPKR